MSFLLPMKSLRSFFAIAVSSLLCSCQTTDSYVTPLDPARPRPPSALVGRSSKPVLTRAEAVPTARTERSENQWRQATREWLGTPYEWGGTGRNGIDCSAFAGVLYRKVAGIELPRTTKQQFRSGRVVSKAELRPGDLVFFETTAAPVSHVGVWLGNGQFAHASTSRGVMVSSLSEPYFATRFRGARRIP